MTTTELQSDLVFKINKNKYLNKNNIHETSFMSL